MSKWYEEQQRGGYRFRRWGPMRREMEQVVGAVMEQIIDALDRAESGLRRAAPGPYAGMGPRPERSDSQIQADVEQAITEDGWVDGRGLTVEVVNRVVTLRGSVPTAEQKRRAGEDAWNVVGVADVQNLLSIGPAIPPEPPVSEAPEGAPSVD